MSESVPVRKKRLTVGARVSGTFGDFYPNPDPNIKRRKRQRIYGIVQDACGPRKYTVCFDSRLIAECFSNTLRLEASSTSIPTDVLAAAVSLEETTMVVNDDALMITENEAAANNVEMEEHFPDSKYDEDDDDDLILGDIELDEAEAEDIGEQRPVGVLNGEPEVDEPTTYAGRKEAANRRIAALLGTKVTIQRGRTESLEWTVVQDSPVETMEVAKENIGITQYGELISDAQAGTFIAQLFCIYR
jgi:hypothetical protein